MTFVPFLLVKPQNAIGYLLGFRWRVWFLWGASALLILAVSFVLWGNWLGEWQVNYTEKAGMQANVNASPISLMGIVPSLLIGAGMAAWALKRRDAVMGLWAGLFFVPCVATYSLLLPFALLAIRYVCVALALSVGFWVMFAPVLLDYLSISPL